MINGPLFIKDLPLRRALVKNTFRYNRKTFITITLRWEGVLNTMKKPPKILNHIVDKVLSYRPKPKTEKAKDSKDDNSQ